MKRRDFLIGIGGAAMSPLGAMAQSGSVRRVGYLALGGRPRASVDRCLAARIAKIMVTKRAEI